MWASELIGPGSDNRALTDMEITVTLLLVRVLTNKGARYGMSPCCFRVLGDRFASCQAGRVNGAVLDISPAEKGARVTKVQKY